MKKRRKTDHCLNCGYALDHAFDYCPKCGQENNDSQISFRKLLKEFFDNYFSLDSRFGRTFKPFFIQPGVLTREFMEGRRVRYANPIRLYLVISLIHFFVFSIYSSGDESDSRGIVQDVAEDSTSRRNVITFSTSDEQDSTASETDFFLNPHSLSQIRNMAKTHTVEEIMDSLNVEDQSYFAKKTLHQLIKVEKSGSTSLKAYIQKNIPILMFFLLPIYALTLKLFFRKQLYIHHVVHSLHLHSFVFTVLTLVWLIGIFTEPPGLLMLSVFLLLSVYLTASFKKTYNTPMKRAILKIFLSGIVYFFILVLSFLVTFTISFYTF